MTNFYQKALIVALLLVLVSAISGIVAFDKYQLNIRLFPSHQSSISWQATPETDVYRRGNSTLKVNDNTFSLNFDWYISNSIDYPYTSIAISFMNDNNQLAMADFSRFTSLSFSVKCTPHNVITFALFTIEPGITKLGDYLTYRSPTTFFSCDKQWVSQQLDLTRLETPQWWIDQFNLELSDRDYDLSQVPKMVFGSTFQSPVETNSNIQIEDISLEGKDWRYIYGFAGLMVLIWGGYGFWYFRNHTQSLLSSLEQKILQDRPLVAYQQLSIEVAHDKERTAILRYMATEYANAELNLDTLVQTLGINRNKINDVLKEELGYTFSAYLNKLRLTEAARLLTNQDEASVSEIAYSVGYKNIPYFNKLFKAEYGCTPKVFKTTYKKNN